MEEMTDEQKLTAILKQQADITCLEIATFCANLCDIHRGHLQVGDMIRQHFGIVSIEVKEKEAKRSHLSVVK